MACSALVELAAGACCVGLYYYRRRRTESTRARWAVHVLAVLMMAALAVHTDVLLSVAYSTVAANRAVVSYVEESTKLIRMQVEAKLDDAGDLPSVLSNNPAEAMDPTSHEIMNPGGEETGDFQQPPKVEDLMDNNTTAEQEFPTSEEAATPPAADEARAPPPAAWRTFSFPSDHVLLLGCSGDELTVRIMPRLEGFEQQLRHANGDGCLRPAAGTLSSYNRRPYYYALFWSIPGMEKYVPVPLMDKESEVPLVMEEAPEAFVLSADLVAFYRPISAGRSEICIWPQNAVGFIPVSSLEEEGQALRPLCPNTIIHFDYQ